MKFTHALNVSTAEKLEMVDITATIKKHLLSLGEISGICLVYTPHTTAGITINENADPNVKSDILEFIKQRVPHEAYFSHREGNSPAHIMSSLISPSETFIIEKGRLVLGTWQGIFFCEFDGPRQRKVYIRVVSD